MVTYENQSPEDIRAGDYVTDALGRSFTALSDACLEMGDYVVLGETDYGSVKWFTLDGSVTVSYDEDYWSEITDW